MPFGYDQALWDSFSDKERALITGGAQHAAKQFQAQQRAAAKPRGFTRQQVTNKVGSENVLPPGTRFAEDDVLVNQRGIPLNEQSLNRFVTQRQVRERTFNRNAQEDAVGLPRGSLTLAEAEQIGAATKAGTVDQILPGIQQAALARQNKRKLGRRKNTEVLVGQLTERVKNIRAGMNVEDVRAGVLGDTVRRTAPFGAVVKSSELHDTLDSRRGRLISTGQTAGGVSSISRAPGSPSTRVGTLPGGGFSFRSGNQILQVPGNPANAARDRLRRLEGTLSGLKQELNQTSGNLPPPPTTQELQKENERRAKEQQQAPPPPQTIPAEVTQAQVQTPTTGPLAQAAPVPVPQATGPSTLLLPQSPSGRFSGSLQSETPEAQAFQDQLLNGQVPAPTGPVPFQGQPGTSPFEQGLEAVARPVEAMVRPLVSGVEAIQTGVQELPGAFRNLFQRRAVPGTGFGPHGSGVQAPAVERPPGEAGQQDLPPPPVKVTRQGRAKEAFDRLERARNRRASTVEGSQPQQPEDLNRGLDAILAPPATGKQRMDSLKLISENSRAIIARLSQLAESQGIDLFNLPASGSQEETDGHRLWRQAIINLRVASQKAAENLQPSR